MGLLTIFLTHRFVLVCMGVAAYISIKRDQPLDAELEVLMPEGHGVDPVMSLFMTIFFCSSALIMSQLSAFALHSSSLYAYQSNLDLLDNIDDAVRGAFEILLGGLISLVVTSPWIRVAAADLCTCDKIALAYPRTCTGLAVSLMKFMSSKSDSLVWQSIIPIIPNVLLTVVTTILAIILCRIRLGPFPGGSGGDEERPQPGPSPAPTPVPTESPPPAQTPCTGERGQQPPQKSSPIEPCPNCPVPHKAPKPPKGSPHQKANSFLSPLSSPSCSTGTTPNQSTTPVQEAPVPSQGYSSRMTTTYLSPDSTPSTSNTLPDKPDRPVADMVKELQLTPPPTPATEPKPVTPKDCEEAEIKSMPTPVAEPLRVMTPEDCFVEVKRIMDNLTRPSQEAETNKSLKKKTKKSQDGNAKSESSQTSSRVLRNRGGGRNNTESNNSPVPTTRTTRRKSQASGSSDDSEKDIGTTDKENKSKKNNKNAKDNRKPPKKDSQSKRKSGGKK